MKKFLATALLLNIGVLMGLPALAQLTYDKQAQFKFSAPAHFNEGVTGQAGKGGLRYVNGGTIWRMLANTGNVTGSATLVGITLPARTFNALSGTGRAIRIRIQGQTAANANTKTLNLLFGGTSVVVLNAASNNQTIYVDAIIRRTGTNTQQISIAGYANNALLNTGSTTSAQTETGTVVLQVQMPAATANNDIILNDVTITGEAG